MSFPTKDYLSPDKCLIPYMLASMNTSYLGYLFYISFLTLINLISVNTLKVIIFVTSAKQ